jgi:hypothetical protein
MLVDEARAFRELCQENGIATTDQPQVLYEVTMTKHDYPSPEGVYAAGEEEGAGDLTGNRLQKHTFICEEWRLSRGEHAP